MHPRRSLAAIGLFMLFALPAFPGVNTWTIKGPNGGDINKFAFDPVNPSIAYAASTNGIFRSVDGGQHWIGAPELLGTPTYDVAVANSDPQKVFVSTVYGLYKSSDRGVTWTTVHPFASFHLAMSRQTANVVYSLATSGPIRSADGGVTFGQTGSGLPAGNSVTGIAVDPQNDSTVYVSFLSTSGVYKSVDGGAHWAAANIGLTSSLYYSLAVDPSNPSTLYVGAGGAIFKTIDGAASWTAQQTSVGSPYCYSLAFSSAVSPSILAAGTNQGMVETTNGGASWTPPLPGLGRVTVGAVAIDPLNAANLLAVTSFNVYRSTNSGTTFSVSGTGLTASYTQAIATDPELAAVVYAAGPGGISRSADRGETWSPAGPLASYFAVDPSSSLTLYAISSGSFIRSVDGGASWQDFRSGLPSGSAVTIATDPHLPSTLYTIVGNAVYRKSGSDPWIIRNAGLPATANPAFVAVDPHDSSTLYTGGSFGVFKSIDGGATWSAANAGIAGVYVPGLAIDPFDSKHLLTSSPIYESKDGAATWTPLLALSGTIAFDPLVKGRVYDNSFAEVDRSGDGGKTWLPFPNGLARQHGNFFAIASDGETIYTGSATGGVWALTFGRERAVRP